MNGKKIFAPCVLLATATLVLGGCGSEEQPLAIGPSTGFVSVALTDAPVDLAKKVCIEFLSVEFKHADDSVEIEPVKFNSPMQVDLLAFQGTDSAPLLLGAEMPAGQYNWVRLAVNAPRGATTVTDDGDAGSACVSGSIVTDPIESGSYIKLENDEIHNLYVPSADTSGLKLNQGFVLPAGGNASFTIDFDLRKSITAPPGQDPDYKLRPTLRMVDNGAVGALQGTVDADLLPSSATSVCTGDPAVYIFAGAVTPDDYDGDEGDALTSAMVKGNDDGATYGYTVGFLAAGSYTAAYTCDPDDPIVDELNADTMTVNFLPAAGVTFEIAPDEMKVLDFPPPGP